VLVLAAHTVEWISLLVDPKPKNELHLSLLEKLVPVVQKHFLHRIYLNPSVMAKASEGDGDPLPTAYALLMSSLAHRSQDSKQLRALLQGGVQEQLCCILQKGLGEECDLYARCGMHGRCDMSERSACWQLPTMTKYTRACCHVLA
jgi:hypothetical protein